MINSCYISIMELRHLRYFVRVAEELHFARAAAQLGISQPPLSQQIRDLENELQVRLFDRTSRSVALTPAGRLFLDAARATLREAENARQVARRAARGELGELAIGFNASAPFVPGIARAIALFRARYPEVRMTLRESGSPGQAADIDRRMLDLGFMRSRARPVLPPALVARCYLSERMFVAMTPHHHLSTRDTVQLADLSGEPMLFYSSEHSIFTIELVSMLREHGVEPNVAQVVSDISTLFGLAAAGVGVMVLAESLCSLQPASLVYRPLSDEAARMTLWLVHHTDNLTLPARNFLAILDEAGAEP